MERDQVSEEGIAGVREKQVIGKETENFGQSPATSPGWGPGGGQITEEAGSGGGHEGPRARAVRGPAGSFRAGVEVSCGVGKESRERCLERWKLASLPPLPRLPLLHLHPAHSPSGFGFGKLHPRSAAPACPHPTAPRSPRLYRHIYCNNKVRRGAGAGGAVPGGTAPALGSREIK